MRHRNKISASEARWLAMEEKERKDKLDEQGLCLHCEDNPQNPHLSAKVCLTCWNNQRPMGCMKDGCPNSTDGTFYQARLCKVHLSDAVHESYQNYLEQKSEIEEQKFKLEQRVKEVGFDPRKEEKQPSALDESEDELTDEWVRILNLEREISFLKKEIKDSMEEVDNIFPEEYEVFG